MTDLRKLDAAATQGLWKARTFDKDNEGDHSMRIGTQRGVYVTLSPDDTALIVALISAYHTGELVGPRDDMKNAPRDGRPVLIYARWDWRGMYGLDCDNDYAWQVASWCVDYDFDDGGYFQSNTENPYWDAAVDPTHWMELPTPKESE